MAETVNRFEQDLIIYDIDGPAIETDSQLTTILQQWHQTTDVTYEGNNPIVNFYYGVHYFLKGESAKSQPFLEKAAQSGFIQAYYYLGKQCQNNQQYSKMLKYYLLAIEKDNVKAMNDLAYYYQYTEVDQTKMEEYYLMAIQRKHIMSMYNLGYSYVERKDYQKALDYFLLAVETGQNLSDLDRHPVERKYWIMAMNALGTVYSQQHDTTNTRKYYMMAYEHGNSKSMQNLAQYYLEIDQQEKAEEIISEFIVTVDNNNNINVKIFD